MTKQQKGYCIVFQWRRDTYDMRYGKQDFRRYRQWAVWPLVFDSREDAQSHIDAIGDRLFAGLRNKCKVSACIETCGYVGRLLNRKDTVNRKTKLHPS